MMSVTTPVGVPQALPHADQGRPEIPATPARRPRLYVLDGLRLVAALLVVSWHYAGLELLPQVWDNNPKNVMPKLHAIAQYGWVGVEIFFMISGFVICMSCWGKSVGQFVVSRLTRLFPAYWFCVLATGAVIYSTRMPWTTDVTKGSYINVLTNLTMLQEAAGQNDLDAVYWTLWVEMRFYLLFGLLAIGGLTYRKVLAFCGLWTIGGLIASTGDSALLRIITFPQYSPFFIAGIAMFLMYRFGPNLLLWGLIGVNWILSVLSLNWLTGDMKFQKIPHIGPFIILSVAFLLLIAVSLGWFNWMQWKWLSTAGALTFPLYMIHEQNGWWVIHLLHGKVNAYLLVGGLTVGMLILAWLIHRLVERPLAKWLDRGLKAALLDIRSKDEKRTPRHQRA